MPETPVSNSRAGTAVLAVIAGSGMGSLAEALTVSSRTSFDAIDGVGACTVPGHAGEVREGTLAGRACLIALGRRHVYERESDAMFRLVEWLAARGATHLLVLSAAGSLIPTLTPGEFLIAHDVMDQQGRARLFGPRSAGPPARPRIDPGLRVRLEQAATRARAKWQRGTLVCGSEPTYETAAEVRALQGFGGAVATMSAVPEILAANANGLPVAVAALVTNPGTGIAAGALSHRDVLAAGARAASQVQMVVMQLVANI